MRLRVKKGIQDQFSHLPEMTLEDLKRLLKRIPAIEDVRVNKIVGAVIIQYNPDTVPPSDWEHYLASGDASAVLTDLDLESGAIR